LQAFAEDSVFHGSCFNPPQCSPWLINKFFSIDLLLDKRMVFHVFPRASYTEAQEAENLFQKRRTTSIHIYHPAEGLKGEEDLTYIEFFFKYSFCCLFV
jgi:hypothetical protein